MENRGVMVFLLIGLVLLISSCVFRTEVPEETRIGGVDIRVLEGQPPLDVIFEDQTFTIGVQLINHIPRQISDAEICVSDTPPDIHGGIQGKICETRFLPAAISYEGSIEPHESDPIFFYPEPYVNLPEGLSKTDFLVTLTYSLETQSSVQICLVKNPNSIGGSFECPAKKTFTELEINNDFAPIIVDRIDSHIVPEGDNNRIRLDIYFKKSPKGQILDLETNRQRFGIDVSIAGTTSDFQCNPLVDGKVEMRESTKKITCYSLLTLDELPYKDVLYVNLAYTYFVDYSGLSNIALEKVYKEGDTDI